ncbi:MAG TPA: zinc ribbon domain-containing protein [Thermomicrobiales bacterium]|nr:zinc ribbon domain-containing protein [Thermomicrobiales bacterium]
MEIEALIARGLQILLALGGAYLIATWFVLAIWTFRDIEARSRSVVTQVFSTLLVVLFWVPGLLLYWLLRPKETLDEAYQRSLEEEYLLQDLEEMPLCPTCNHFVEDEWQLCPHCNTQLREHCPSCDHLIDLRWDVCPYCGTEHHAHTHDDGHRDGEVAEERWVDPAVIAKRLRDAELRRERAETKALPAMTAASVDDRRELMESLRRLDVLRDAPAPNGHGTPVPEPVTATAADGAKPDDEVRTFGPNLDDIAEGRDDTEDSGEPETIPDRFKVR